MVREPKDLFDYLRINPGLISAFLMSPDRVRMKSVEDDDVDYHYSFQIPKGVTILRGGHHEYDSYSKFWTKEFRIKVKKTISKTKAAQPIAAAATPGLPLQDAYSISSAISRSDSVASGFEYERLADQTDNTGSFVHRMNSNFRNWYRRTFYKPFTAAAFQSSMKNLASVDAIEFYVELAEALDNDDFFSNEALQIAVDYAWQEYGFPYHVFNMTLYIAFLIITSICNYKFLTWSSFSGEGYYNAGQGICILVIIFNTYFAVFDVLLSLIFLYLNARKDLQSALSTVKPTNIFDLIVYFLVYYGSYLRIANNGENRTSAAVMSAATLALWFNLIYYLRPFKAVTYIQIMCILYVQQNNQLHRTILLNK